VCGRITASFSAEIAHSTPVVVLFSLNARHELGRFTP
jgi:hypothetical protein